MIGLYIHIPFCRRKCLYCNFYSIPYDYGPASRFIPSILKQIEKLDMEFSSVYIGGGTPSILDTDLLDRFLNGLKGIIKQGVESTVEVNPDSLDYDRLRLFLDNGINRISIGVQSFDDRKLKLLGRLHEARQSEKAIELSKSAGFKNISIDMIFGVNSESLKSWQTDIEKAAGFDISHISCYSLSYEKGTPIYNMKDTCLDEEILAEMYRHAMAYLPAKGFEHYEVSNFARPGFECAHNLNYWDNNFYYGIGPSAVSYINGIRSENISDVNEYIKRHENGMDLTISREKLASMEKARETASLKIRTRDGIGYSWFKNKTDLDFKEIEKGALAELIEGGLIECNNKKARLTEKGFLFSDTVSAGFL